MSPDHKVCCLGAHLHHCDTTARLLVCNSGVALLLDSSQKPPVVLEVHAEGVCRGAPALAPGSEESRAEECQGGKQPGCQGSQQRACTN